MYRFSSKGFTLVEIIVAVSIIAVMTTVGAVMYSRSIQDSRDSRRKLDLLAIRSALELYRSNTTEGYYPVDISALSPKYLEKIPQDPKSGNYQYAPVSSTGTTCDNTSTYCVYYTLTATMESGTQLKVNPNTIN